MTRSNRMKFRLRDFCNGANLRRADLERRAVHLISLRSKWFRSKERGTGVKDRAKNGTFSGSRYIFRAAKTENLVSRRSLIFLCS